MSNPHTGEVSIVVGETPYRLFLTTNAIVQLEELLSTPEKTVTFFDVLAAANRNSIKHMRALIWASLREYHPDLTILHVGQLIDEAGGIVKFSKQIEALTKSSQPDKADLDAMGVSGQERTTNPPAARRRGTGPASTPRPGASG